VLLLAGHASAQGPVGTTFTYQGQLKQAGVEVNDLCDFEFRIFDAPVAGTQIGPTLTFDGVGGNPPAVNVVDGLFTVQLDFGTGVFGGEQRFLEISVRCPSGVGGYTTLAPRQPITAAPYALFALDSPPDFNIPFFAQIDRPEEAFAIINDGGTALAGASPQDSAVYGLTDGGIGIHGQSSGLGPAIHGEAFDRGHAVRGDALSGSGVRGASSTGSGVEGESVDGVAVRAVSFGNAVGVHATTMGDSAGVFELHDVSVPQLPPTFLGPAALRATTNTGVNAFVAATTGSARAGLFRIDRDPNNPVPNEFPALEVRTEGTGSAGVFDAADGIRPALDVTHEGDGPAASFTNSSDERHTVLIENNGNGEALIIGGPVVSPGGLLNVHYLIGSERPATKVTSGDDDNPYPALLAIQNGEGPVAGPAGRFEVRPFIGPTSTNASAALEVKTTGLGSGAQVEIANPANDSTALWVSTDGTGPAGRFEVNSPASPAEALKVSSNSAVGGVARFETTAGTTSNTDAVLIDASTSPGFALNVVQEHPDGAIANFTQNAPGMAGDAVNVGVNNDGHALKVTQFGTGEAAHFEIADPANDNNAVFVRTDGPGVALSVENGNPDFALALAVRGRSAFNGQVDILGPTGGPVPVFITGPVNIDGNLTVSGGEICGPVCGPRFLIRTDKPHVEVSWQVTGVRQDAYALAHPLQVEVHKPEQERGLYLHPQAFGVPEELGMHSEARRRIEAERTLASAAERGAVAAHRRGSELDAAPVPTRDKDAER